MEQEQELRWSGLRKSDDVSGCAWSDGVGGTRQLVSDDHEITSKPGQGLAGAGTGWRSSRVPLTLGVRSERELMSVRRQHANVPKEREHRKREKHRVAARATVERTIHATLKVLIASLPCQGLRGPRGPAPAIVARARQPERRARGGQATGIILAAAVTAAFGLPMRVNLIIEYLAGFAFGLFVFQSLFMKEMLGGSYWNSVRTTFWPEFMSMNAMMAGMAPASISAPPPPSRSRPSAFRSNGSS